MDEGKDCERKRKKRMKMKRGMKNSTAAREKVALSALCVCLKTK